MKKPNDLRQHVINKSLNIIKHTISKKEKSKTPSTEGGVGTLDCGRLSEKRDNHDVNKNCFIWKIFVSL